MTAATNAWLNLLTEIADRADPIALRYFRSTGLAVDAKPDPSPVTVPDRSIEEGARELVARRHPGLGIFGEEFGETSAASGARLIIDPIDGTRNFVRGIPIFASLLAIEERGDVIAGLVSAPAMGMRWHAVRGQGAFCGARRLAVSSIRDLATGQVFHGDVSGQAEKAPPPVLPAGLPVARHFDSVGLVLMLSGFGPDDTYALFSQGGGAVGRRHDFDATHFSIYKRGYLALDTGGRTRASSPAPSASRT